MSVVFGVCGMRTRGAVAVRDPTPRSRYASRDLASPKCKPSYMKRSRTACTVPARTWCTTGGSLSIRGAFYGVLCRQWACFMPGREFHSVRTFTFGHPCFEIAGYLFAAFPPRHQPADWPVAPCGSAAVRQANRLVDAETRQWRKGTLRAPNVQRLATGDG